MMLFFKIVKTVFFCFVEISRAAGFRFSRWSGKRRIRVVFSILTAFRSQTFTFARFVSKMAVIEFIEGKLDFEKCRNISA